MDTAQALSHAFLAAHPVEAAAIIERLPIGEWEALLADVPAATTAAVLGAMAPAAAVACLAAMPAAGAAPVVGALGLHPAASLLRRLDAAAREPLLAALPAREASRLRAVLRHPEGTAGALMDPCVPALPESALVREAREHLLHAPQTYSYVYVVRRDQSLSGVVGAHELLVAPLDARLETVMCREVISLPVTADPPAILASPGWRRHHALPVTERGGAYAGAIRYEMVRRLEAEAASRPQGDALAAFVSAAEVYWTGVSGLAKGLVAPRPAGEVRRGG